VTGGTTQLAGSVADAFARTAARCPERDWLQVLPDTAQCLGIEARTWTYADADAEIKRLRAGYAAAGLGRGHRAGLLLLNRPEFLLHWLALNGLGVSIVPINPDWRAHELEYLVAHSEIAVAACLDERRDDLHQAARAAGRQLAITGPRGDSVERVAPAAATDSRSMDTDTECALLYTSGTTGRPKGCVLTNEYFLWGGTWYAQIGGLCIVRPDVERMLTPLPLTHMNALACSAMCMMLTGGCLTLLDRFHPRSWWRNVRESRATIVHYLGVMPAMLLAAEESSDDRRHDVQYGFGAGVNPRHHAEFERRFGFPLLEAWAMTETGVGGVVIANREPRFVGTACFGSAADDVECRVVDDAGHDVPADVPGELVVRHAGPNPHFGFFREYLKDPEATAAAWQDGWFHTGDLVTRDRLGYFRFVDRKKNVIRRSGENISAVEVESVLAQHPAVRAVGVTAVPDAVRGDEVFACVVPREAEADAAAFARDVATWCRERLAYYKTPGYVALVSTLPLTPTEKIQRAKLKELAAGILAQGACCDVRDLKRRGGA
jgi:acyl-CoA synthetase (AMP-forming)/AMP-acid ligase II